MPKAPKSQALRVHRRCQLTKDCEKQSDNRPDSVRLPTGSIKSVSSKTGVNHRDHVSNTQDVGDMDDLDSVENGLKDFLNFCHVSNIHLHEKVICTSQGVSSNYGMVAVGDIQIGESLFIIPRSAVLSPESCTIANFLAANAERLTSNSGWLPLILAILYEKFNPKSKWRGYLDTFPNVTALDMPMFWPLAELEAELKCTGMVSSVATDLLNMKQEYESIFLPFITEHPEHFADPRYKDFDVIKQICAFIMAYSFTDDISTKVLSNGDSSDSEEEVRPPTTIMVPLADILNHVPDHNAELNIGESTFRMIAVKDIKQGEEVYNTYGKVSNYTLLLMYGFAVPPQTNPHSILELKLKTIEAACLQTEYPDWEMRTKYIRKLAESAQDAFNQSICLHSEGLSDTSHILKGLTMDKEELQAKLMTLELKGESEDSGEDDDWLSDNEDDEEIASDDLKEFDESIKRMLFKVTELMLSEFPSSPPAALMRSSVPSTSLSNRQVFSMYVRESQASLLRKLQHWVS